MKKTETERYGLTIHKRGLPETDLNIVFFSDLHNCVDDTVQSMLLDRIEAEQPDLVLCGGDMLVGKPGYPVLPAVRFMTELSKRYTVWAGTGNHEFRTRIYPEVYGEMYREYTEPLREAGVVFLEDRREDLTVRNIPVSIYGLEIGPEYYDRIHKRDLPVSEITDRFGVPAEGRVTILLAHNPRHLAAYKAWGADLTLCGHYHGGVMRLGGNRGLISPDFRIFPPYVYGHITENDRHIIITAGIGEHTIPFRIRNPREIVSVRCRIRS